MRRSIFVLVALLAAVSLPILAEGDDAAAVVRFCGPPSAERQVVSPVTNLLERDLTYGSLILHFQASPTGWNFLSGWHKHLPQTEKMVGHKMPCFARAMAASAAVLPSAGVEDPSIRAQTQAPANNAGTFGIPHLWFILALVVLALVLAFMPSSRRRPFRASEVGKMHSRRKPLLEPRKASSRVDY